MDNFNYTQLDPGIRCVVRLLHRWGYETSDSGDGRTKQANKKYDERDLMAVPHVVIVEVAICNSLFRVTEEAATELYWELAQNGVTVTPQGMPGASIQYTYCPATDTTPESAMLMLMDLSDDDLPDDLRAEMEAEIAPKPTPLCGGPDKCAHCDEARRKGHAPHSAWRDLAEVCGDAWDGVDAAAYVDELRGKDREGGDE